MTRSRAFPRSQLPRPYAGDVQRADQIRNLSDAVLQGWHQEGAEVVRPFDIICILDEPLPRAESSKKPSSAKATLVLWDYEKEEYREPADYLPADYEMTDEEIEAGQETVYNFSEDKEYDEDTFGFGEWREPHHWFAGDCEAMVERRSPTALEGDEA